MKLLKLKTGSKMVAFAAMAFAGFSAHAQSVTGQLNVNANVVAACSIGTVGDLNFGNYVQNNSVLPPIEASSSIELTCGSGVAYNVRLSGMNNTTDSGRSMFVGANELKYQLYRDAARTPIFAWGDADNTNTFDGVGTGLVRTIPVYGSLPRNAFNNATATGAYTAVVTITVAY
jgi:spore coat protein U-like protein